MKITKIALLLAASVAAATIFANAQTQVFVPGNASGYFGNWNDSAVPFVPAITVTGPATITVTYVSGKGCWGTGRCVGPNGGTYSLGQGFQFPLEEAKGLAPHKTIHNIEALIGVFVCQSRVQRSGFQAIDGTKNAVPVGIMPGGLFFIGTGKTFDVKEAGTLFLGINDTTIDDNSGGFNVTVSAQ